MMTLIKRTVTADRGLVILTTQDVFEVIMNLSNPIFSTRDIADVVRDRVPGIRYDRLEYSVRQSVTWLVKRGYVEVSQDTVKRYTRAKAPYWAACYCRIERMGPCDVGLLNRIFMHA